MVSPGDSKKHILVAMSGGVDSSTAAGLLVEQGHRVIGVTLRLLKTETGFGCCGSSRDIEDAKAVCHKLGIPHYVLDFSKEFQDNIVDPFSRSYASGETPNPCIACNRFVKFDALLNKAMALGADGVATGHYARVKAEGVDGQITYKLLRSLNREKDQSYVLYNLGQRQLSKLFFPVGEMPKSEVRDLARKFGLRTAEKPDSQEICFVPGADTASYLKKRFESADAPLTSKPGDIRDTEGRLLGQHRGAAFYTRGQRQGLGLSLGRPVYVVDINAETNTLIVGSDQETLCERFDVRDVQWTAGRAPADVFDADVQIRSHHEAAPCRIDARGADAQVGWKIPQRAVTPGQSAVFYRGDELLGGGFIARVYLASAAEKVFKEALWS